MFYWLFTSGQEILGNLFCAVPLFFAAIIIPAITSWWMGADIRLSRENNKTPHFTLQLLTHLVVVLAVTSLYTAVVSRFALDRGYSKHYDGTLALLVGNAPLGTDEEKLLKFGMVYLGILLFANGSLHQNLRPGGWLRGAVDRLQTPGSTRGEVGSAHFCSPGEYRRYRVHDPEGLTIYGAFWGENQRRLDSGRGEFCLNGEDAARGVLTIGRAGSGKTQAVILPAIADHMLSGHSLIVADPQGEIKHKVLEIARATGHLVVIHDPTSDDGPRFNLAQGVANVTDARTIAQVLIKDEGGGDNKFWTDNAISLLAACLLCFENLGEIHGSLKDVAKLAEEIQQRSVDAANLASAFIANATTKDPKIASSIIATLATSLTGWADPKVCYNTSSSDFDAELICSQPTIVVLTCPGRARGVYAPYLGATFTKLLQDLDTIGERNRGPLPLPVALILDEFPILGKLDRLVEDVNLVRKRRISVMIAAQTKGQFHMVYGDEATDALFAGLAHQIIFGGCDDKTADFYSKASGTMTQISRGKSENSHDSVRSRSLLTTDEVKAPAIGNCTIFASYVEERYATEIVLNAQLTRYYQRKDIQAQIKAAKDKAPFLLQRDEETLALTPTVAQPVVAPPAPPAALPATSIPFEPAFQAPAAPIGTPQESLLDRLKNRVPPTPHNVSLQEMRSALAHLNIPATETIGDSAWLTN